MVLNWWVSFAPDFQCCYFCESSCLFYLRFNFYFYVSKIMHLFCFDSLVILDVVCCYFWLFSLYMIIKVGN